MNYSYKLRDIPPLVKLPEHDKFEPREEEQEYKLGYFKSREIYKRIHLLATKTQVPDYNNDGRFYCLHKIYIDYLVDKEYGRYERSAPKDVKLIRMAFKNEMQTLIPEGSKEFQEHVTKSVSEFAKFLCSKYEELDEQINDEDNDDERNEFYNYYGNNDLALWTTSDKYNTTRWQRYNEVKRWSKIIMELPDHIMEEFRNPYVTTLIEPYLRKDPTTFVSGPNDVKIGMTDFVNKIRLHEELVKNEIAENENVRFPKGISINNFKINPQRIQCSKDVKDILEFYQLLLKFHNTHSWSKARPQKSTLMMLLGYLDKGSLQNLAEKANNRYIKYLKIADEDNSIKEETRNLYYLWADREYTLAEALYSTKSFLMSTPEDYLLDKNNRNAVGALKALESYESGTWNSRLEEVPQQTLRVQFETDKTKYTP